MAETRKAATAKAALEAKLALEPVSIYISRATQKLYVRRNTHKPAPDGGGEVFDSTIEVPVTIRDPGKPIGTHVFTAVARDGAGLRWTAVTIDDGDDARNALDRITIPKDVLDRIAPTALPRSSIIISDEPLSEETNYRTEFVAVLSNQPQGGFITRERTPEVAVTDPYGDDGFLVFPTRLGLSRRLWGPQPGSQRGQTGAPRGGGSLTGPQRGWGSQPDNSGWRRRPVFSPGATTLVIGGWHAGRGPHGLIPHGQIGYVATFPPRADILCGGSHVPNGPGANIACTALRFAILLFWRILRLTRGLDEKLCGGAERAVPEREDADFHAGRELNGQQLDPLVSRRKPEERSGENRDKTPSRQQACPKLRKVCEHDCARIVETTRAKGFQ